MEEYNIDLHSPNRTPLSEMSSTIEIFNNLVSVESSGSNIQGIMQLANGGPNDHHQLHDGFTDQIPEFDLTAHIVSSSYGYSRPNMILEPEAIMNSTSYHVSGNGNLRANDDNNNNKVDHQEFQNYVGKKRKRAGEREMEKDREVVHVRAKRGQATDSHSLAERLRREKINEKLRCLQDLVPGCYKTMGLAVTLDVIINYVRSLQNQIDFLSMKLSAASLYYDFNSSEPEAVEAVQTTSNGYEAQLGMDKEPYEGIFHFQSQA